MLPKGPPTHENSGNSPRLQKQAIVTPSLPRARIISTSQVPLGTSHSSPVNYQDRSPCGLYNDVDDTGVQGFYDADDVNGISEGGDDAYQSSESQDPLLGKLSLTKHLQLSLISLL